MFSIRLPETYRRLVGPASVRQSAYLCQRGLAMGKLDGKVALIAGGVRGEADRTRSPSPAKAPTCCPPAGRPDRQAGPPPRLASHRLRRIRS
jgi:hypothetical protein